MKILFIGGTGNISTSCTRVALAKGMEVVHFNRGKRQADVGGPVTTIHGDVHDAAAMKRLLGDARFDAVVDWIAYTTQDIERDIEVFRGATRQFVFISSASAYHKPPSHWVITESTPVFNPYWEYSRNKIACERMLRDAYEKEGFPATVVRPSHTYSTGWLPTAFGSDFTVARRMIDGKRVIVHGDGQSLWTLTHANDFAVGFVGLLGDHRTIGETFHITSDEAISWDHIHRIVGAAFGVEPTIVHMPSEFIAQHAPGTGAGLLGDKAYSVVFDNSKIKRFVPDFQCRISFVDGMRRSAAWCREHPETMVINPAADREIDMLLEKWGER